MSGFVPALMQIVQPEPEPETPREKARREQREKRDAESVGGIPKQNLWKGRDA